MEGKAGAQLTCGSGVQVGGVLADSHEHGLLLQIGHLHHGAHRTSQGFMLV